MADVLRTTKRGMGIISTFEGRRRRAYKCSAGVWTIGVGHTSAAGGFQVHADSYITDAEIDKILADDINTFENGVERLLRGKNHVETYEFDALVSLAFNIGLGAFAKSTVLARYLRGQTEQAAAAFGLYVKAKGKTIDGLVRRRKAEMKLFLGQFDHAKFKPETFKAEDMARAVDKPKPPKSMVSSTEGNAAIAVGGVGVPAGLGTAYVAGKAAVSAASDVKDTAATAAEFLGVSGSAAVAIGLGALMIAGCVYIWLRRRYRLEVDLA